MALTVTNTPVGFSSVHGDVIFTVYESVKATDPVTYPDYKYICDVYVSGVMVARLKAYPEPAYKKGIFNIGAIIRNYLQANFNPSAGVRAQEFGIGNFFVEAGVRFSEEYGFTTYISGADIDYSNYYNHYNLNYNGTSDFKTYGVTSNRPLINSIKRDATKFYIPFLANSTDLYRVQFLAYDENDNLLTNNAAYFNASVSNNLQIINVAPTVVNATYTNAITAATAYYIVNFGINGDPAPVEYRFNLTCENIFTNYTLHFLNQYGGIESMEFRKISRRTYDVEKKNFTQLPYRMSSGGAISYHNSGNVIYDAKTTYSSIIKEKLKLTTDNLTDAQHRWLREIVFSPLVYLQSGNMLIPVTIINTNYEERRFVNDKTQSPLIIDLEMPVQLNAQFR